MTPSAFRMDLNMKRKAFLFSPVSISSFPQIAQMADVEELALTVETLPGNTKQVLLHEEAKKVKS